VIKRDSYLAKIKPFMDKPVIKVITGMRRSGKSVILRLLREKLLERRVAEKRILYLNFESQSLDPFTDRKKLYKHISGWAKKTPGRLYVMLDEVQRISEWEKTVASCKVDFNCDIYITGSNSRLLSGELHTLLAGRFVEIPVHPLSFAEHLIFTKACGEDTGKDQNRQFLDYLQYGGLPGIHEMDINSSAVYPYLTDIYNSLLLKDVLARHRIRDTELLERVVKFLMDNRGSIFSAKRVIDFLKNQGRRLSGETVYNYIRALEEAFLIRKVSRYDIRGKKQLETQEKYFFEDHGIQHAILGFKDDALSGLLENVVFMELKRRGWNACVGQMKHTEVDFIAQRQNEKMYIQVCYLLSGKETVEREFGALEGIKDNYPKIVLSMDPLWDYNRGGILRKNLVEFILDEKW
jgi:predicted AAA+ superfamily ATPase